MSLIIDYGDKRDYFEPNSEYLCINIDYRIDNVLKYYEIGKILTSRGSHYEGFWCYNKNNSSGDSAKLIKVSNIPKIMTKLGQLTYGYKITKEELKIIKDYHENRDE